MQGEYFLLKTKDRPPNMDGRSSRELSRALQVLHHRRFSPTLFQ